MKIKKTLLLLALAGCFFFSSCALHVDRDPWPASEQDPAAQRTEVPVPAADPSAAPRWTEAPGTEQEATVTATPALTADPNATPEPTVDPAAAPGMNG